MNAITLTHQPFPRIEIVDATPACNIGKGELRRRRDAAIAVAAALGLALLAIAAGVIPSWTAPYVGPLAGAAVIAVLQYRLRFCVAFGLAGLVGMGAEPGAAPVDPSMLAAHRRRAALMVAAAAGVTLAWVLATGFLVVLGD